MTTSTKLHEKRKLKVRFKLRQICSGRPRLSVHRTGSHISVQLIDDTKGCTIAAASSVEKEVRAKLKSGANISAAKEVGKLVAERAIKAGIKTVVFDRSGYLYHGRVRALAESARECGLDF